MTTEQLDLLARVYALILAWPDNENAGPNADDVSTGTDEQEFPNSSSCQLYHTVVGGEDISNESE